MQAWANADLELSPTLRKHIDSCLTCRACESMCPALVPYGQLVNEFRSATNAKTSSLSLIIKKTLTSRHIWLSKTLLRVYHSSGLSKLLFRRLAKFSGNQSNPGGFATHYSANGEKKGQVALFTGCASTLFDNKTLADAITVLQRCGFDVDLPSQQVCCGALDLHAGDKKVYRAFASQNKQAFDASAYDAIVSVASGCGSTLLEYQPKTNAQVVDISQFIEPYIATLDLRPLASTAWVHTPCTLKHVFPKNNAVADNLSYIEGLKLNLFDKNQVCCGSAGLYMISHPETSEALLNLTLGVIKTQPTNYLLTSNIGCALHINAGLNDAGLNTQVLHPVSLLAQQLKD
ncbi:MAG: hypothetical protein A6F71_05340 [Cycloclasticus sp. symbiont of Poecilosclerida sp. M]|nr:MAG: hypothetical protein A6F71_05340 [Cycloclasticus sp. symbiont of Poecilosclerida sp. M]